MFDADVMIKVHHFFNQAQETAVSSKAALHLSQAGRTQEGRADVGYVDNTSK